MVFTGKHIINNPSDLVVDSLEGLCAFNPYLSLDVQNKVAYRKTQDRNKVAIICGGGSGHEPSHAGFVGEGMLTAAVCGSVFASPNASQVKHAIGLVENDKGTLIIVKNYTGDVLCFGLSREQYAATQPAEKQDRIKFLIVGDDVAVGKTQGSIVGRRGLAGTVLVYKIAGALAERGSSLDEVYDAAQFVASRLATIGCGLDHCHVLPGTSSMEASIKPDEIEIGLGIHNEPGFNTVSPVPSRKDLMKQLANLLTLTTDSERSFVPFSLKGDDEVVLMVNNLGGLSELELSGIAREALSTFSSKGIKVLRLLVGTFMTSLNMPGFSLTLLLLPKSTEKAPMTSAELLNLVDATADTPGWRWSASSVPITSASTTAPAPRSSTSQAPASHQRLGEAVIFTKAISKACRALISAEPEITRLDTIVGDGDCGLTLKSGAEAVLQELDLGSITSENLIQSVVQISRIAEEKMGGTSGALYSIFFSALSQGLSREGGEAKLDKMAWSRALTYALDGLYRYTRARPPSRTLVDPLAAFIKSLEAGSTVQAAVKNAADAADQTATIQARVGRSAYVEDKHLKDVADPGAVGVKVILQSI